MRRTKEIKKIMLCLALLLFSLALAAPPSLASEVITDFESRIQIHEDSSLSVTETIRINVENISIKRGIIRHFPLSYKDAGGRSFRVGFRVTGATLDGVSAPFEISDDGSYANVRIGDPNGIIPRGPHTFEISYETTLQVGFFNEFDELYWNVTGNGWSWPILRASCTVRLPEKFSGEKFRSVEWYTGRYGEKGDAVDAKRVGENGVATTRALAAGEGLTVVYTWKKGIVAPPPSPFGNERAQHAIAFGTLLLSCVWFFFSLSKLKDDDAPAVIPRFYPPDASSPAFVRRVRNSVFDRVSISANLIDLAVKGALKIEEKESGGGLFGIGKDKKFYLHSLESDAKLTRDEEVLLRRLFPASSGLDELAIDKSNAKTIARANAALRGAVNALARGLTADNFSFCVTGALIFAAGIASTLPFTGQSWGAAAAAALLGGGVMLISFARKPAPADSLAAKAKGTLASLLPAVIAAFFASAAYGGERGPLLTVLPFIASAALTAALRPLSLRRTKRGKELHSEIEGLYMYVATAEKERLEMFNAPEDTPEVYERLLPYAVAMGAAKTWGERFAKVLEAADYTPQWYDGPSPYLFMSGGFGNFTDSLSSSVAAGMPKPEFSPTISSGSGGGGFSGGGGGGGGGSGW